MPKARQAGPPEYTPESCHQAILLKAYCELKFPVGQPTTRHKSITGENYREFSRSEAITPVGARDHAQDAFDQYAKGRNGTLYWRIVPEIAKNTRTAKYGYYMRLLISDKPVIEAAHV